MTTATNATCRDRRQPVFSRGLPPSTVQPSTQLCFYAKALLKKGKNVARLSVGHQLAFLADDPEVLWMGAWLNGRHNTPPAVNPSVRASCVLREPTRALGATTDQPTGTNTFLARDTALFRLERRARAQSNAFPPVSKGGVSVHVRTHTHRTTNLAQNRWEQQ